MKKYKIVIVENDEDEQIFMIQGFRSSGLFEIMATVREGNSLFDWLEKNQSTPPDFVLSDLNMPGKNGFEIITEMHRHASFNSIPVVITSTSSIQAVIDQCLAMGAALYITKPDTFVEYVPFAQRLYGLIEEKKLV